MQGNDPAHVVSGDALQLGLEGSSRLREVAVEHQREINPFGLAGVRPGCLRSRHLYYEQDERAAPSKRKESTAIAAATLR